MSNIINEEAERGVLGSCLIDSMMSGAGDVLAIDTSLDAGCDESWFSLAKHKLLWQAMVEMHVDGKVVDMVTVGSKTKDYDLLNDLVDNTPSSTRVRSYLDIAEKCAKLRSLRDIAERIVDSIHMDGADIEQVTAEAAEAIDSITSTRDRISLREHMMNNIKVLKDAMAGKSSGLPLPWQKFSDKTGGVQSKSVCPLVGRDGKGKSGAAAQITDYWAGLNIPVLYISLEDDPRRTLLRMAGCRKWFSAREWEQASSYIEGRRVMLCDSEAELLEKKLLEYTDWLETKRCEVIDGDFTGEQVFQEIRAFRRRQGVKDDEVIGVFVDGFKDLIPSRGDGTTAEESHTAKQLQRAAKRCNAAILPVSHILKIDDGVLIKKENIKGSGTQFQGARQVLIFQDAGCAEIGDDDFFMLSATKANFASGGSTILRRDAHVLKYQEM